ncbi:MAG: hypothetical protein E6Q34_06940 [Burkholderiaceae bacterium]|nr:MAG: hypothetical protein E6Q34_06940 [Burkholderiaceae bacterium]
MKLVQLFIALSFFVWSSAAQAQTQCEISTNDFLENAKLSFEDFDQKGITPKTSRALGNAKCYLAAVEVSEQYLAMNLNLSARERAIVTWHMAQYLAFAGKEKEAAKLMLASLNGKEIAIPEDQFDWNTYVIGTWAFIHKNRPLLEQSLQTLQSRGGQRNTMNGNVLQGFLNCFEASYESSYGAKACTSKK